MKKSKKKQKPVFGVMAVMVENPVAKAYKKAVKTKKKGQ